MNRPLLVCGSLSASPEHPSDWSIDVQSSISQNTTLNGTVTKDVMYRKYIYVLTWEAMSKTDFDELNTLINYHNDNSQNILFTYTKWAQSATVREVVSLPLERSMRAGSGSSNYYQSVTLTLIEVNKR
jgi:hypothetical protein